MLEITVVEFSLTLILIILVVIYGEQHKPRHSNIHLSIFEKTAGEI